MNALLVYPEHEGRTYWSFSGALPYVERRAALPPLGLATIAALLPAHWNVRILDMNVETLSDADLSAADVVLTSTMIVQARSLDAVAERCRRLGVPMVAGGPYPTACSHRLTHVDHLFVGEAEGAIAELTRDLERGRARRVYHGSKTPDLEASPIPRFDLLDLGAYASMAVQHSRGCPFSCEFCDIWTLYGRRHRVKPPERVALELDALWTAGWRGPVFFVDDNFIGNRRLATRSLEAIERWQRAHGYPFRFYTEASVNLGADDALMRHMRDAGFNLVFLGIETPSRESLAGAGKSVNANLDLPRAIRRIQAHGMEVSGGFIVGFDQDTDDIFDRQIDFIRETAIPAAMVGLLGALEGTALHERLEREGRLLDDAVGDNTHRFRTNFRTRMPAERLAEGYARIVGTLYDPTLRHYFDRCERLLERLGPNPRFSRPVVARELRAFARSLGTVFTKRYGRQYLRFLARSTVRFPSKFPEAVRLAIQGFHFESITREALACEAIERDAGRTVDRFARIARDAASLGETEVERVRALIEARREALRELRRRIARLTPDARVAAVRAYRDAAHRISALAAKTVPSASETFEAGARRFASLVAALRAEAELVRERAQRAHADARRGVSEFGREWRELERLRRESWRRARRWVRRLPVEYRKIGELELREFRRRLDEFVAGPPGSSLTV